MSDTDGRDWKPIFDEDGTVNCESLSLDDGVVVLADGSILPIVSYYDEEYDEVEHLSEAQFILCGSPEFGYFEIELGTLGPAPTYH